MENNEILTVMEMKDYLKIGRAQAYQLVHEPGFPAIRINRRSIRIPKKSLDEWLENKNELAR